MHQSQTPRKLNGSYAEGLTQFLGEADAWPDFIQEMTKALGGGEATTDPRLTSPERHSWWNLPELCCQAAGGEWSAAQPFAIAWGLLYAAAHIMDDVEDQDPRLRLNQNVAINAATGLYASSGMIISRLVDAGLPYSECHDIQRRIQNTILLMCSAQHREFSSSSVTLEEAWRIAEAKSGSFFALACRVGAQLAAANQASIDAFNRYGRHLGLLIQLANDMKDVAVAPQHAGCPPRISIASIPVAYTLSVAGQPTCQQLLQVVKLSAQNRNANLKARHLMKQEGAVLFLMANIEKQRVLATRALQEAAPDCAALRRLQEMVTETAPMK